MSNQTLPSDSEDIIDNRLESFPFFPIRLTCSLIAICCLCAAVFAIATFNFSFALAALLFFAATFSIAIIQKRITVNVHTNKYRAYNNFWGIKKGKWESFKGFTIITITPSNQIQRLGSRFGVNSINVANTTFHLNLKKDNYNKLNIAAGSYDSMLKKAITLAHRFKVGIMDCSEKPNRKYTYEEVVQHFPKKTY
jgi:hypothetical protein